MIQLTIKRNLKSYLDKLIGKKMAVRSKKEILKHSEVNLSKGEIDEAIDGAIDTKVNFPEPKQEPTKTIIHCVFEIRRFEPPVLIKAFVMEQTAKQYCTSIQPQGYNLVIKQVELDTSKTYQ